MPSAPLLPGTETRRRPSETRSRCDCFCLLPFHFYFFFSRFPSITRQGVRGLLDETVHVPISRRKKNIYIYKRLGFISTPSALNFVFLSLFAIPSYPVQCSRRRTLARSECFLRARDMSSINALVFQRSVELLREATAEKWVTNPILRYVCTRTCSQYISFPRPLSSFSVNSKLPTLSEALTISFPVFLAILHLVMLFA